MFICRNWTSWFNHRIFGSKCSPKTLNYYYFNKRDPHRLVRHTLEIIQFLKTSKIIFFSPFAREKKSFYDRWSRLSFTCSIVVWCFECGLFYLLHICFSRFFHMLILRKKNICIVHGTLTCVRLYGVIALDATANCKQFSSFSFIR